MDPSNVLEEAAFVHERDEVELVVVAPLIAAFPSSGENAQCIVFAKLQCPMDEGSGRSEHCFARQRTRFEGSKIIIKHVQNVVDNFLGETHAAVVDCTRDWVEVNRLLRPPVEQSKPSTEWLNKPRW